MTSYYDGKAAVASRLRRRHFTGMKHKGNIVQFIHSAEAASTTWHLDEVTKDVVTTCESCNAEARHSPSELEVGFSFQHHEGCPYDVPANTSNESRNDRAYELAARLGNILEGEDSSLVVSTLSFLSAVACQVEADEANVSIMEVAARFVSNFERALQAADTICGR
jgi:hypothetical protein